MATSKLGRLFDNDWLIFLLSLVVLFSMVFSAFFLLHKSLEKRNIEVLEKISSLRYEHKLDLISDDFLVFTKDDIGGIFKSSIKTWVIVSSKTEKDSYLNGGFFIALGRVEGGSNTYYVVTCKDGYGYIKKKVPVFSTKIIESDKVEPSLIVLGDKNYLIVPKGTVIKEIQKI